jgi:protein TonB
VFGTAAVVASGLLGMLLLSIRLIPPPTPAIDAGPMAVFVAESIPLDQPQLDQPQLDQPQLEQPRLDKPEPSDHVPPSADPRPPFPTAEPPSQSVASVVPTTSAPSSIAAPSNAPPAQSVEQVALPASPLSGTKSGESPAATSPAAAADWRARLLGHLKRYRRYPRQAEATRQQGVARVAITLSRSGELIAVELVHGSGYPLLDMEARNTVRRAAPLPAVDDAVPGDPVTVEVPIEFALRR